MAPGGLIISRGTSNRHGIVGEEREKYAGEKRERREAAPFADSTGALSLRSVHVAARGRRILGALLLLGELGHQALGREQQPGDARRVL